MENKYLLEKNEAKYFVVDKETQEVIAAIYEHPHYGRTIIQYKMVRNGDFSFVELYDDESNIISECSFTEFIHTMLLN